MIRALFFDFGGTLDSDGGHWLDRFLELYAAQGVTIDRDRLKAAFYKADDACYQPGLVRHRTFRELLRFHVDRQLEALNIADPQLADALARGFVEPSYETMRRNVRILQGLKSRYRIGVISNWYGNLREICEETGLAPMIDAVIDSGVVQRTKPDPEIFSIALRRLDVAASEACMVGDNFERDMVPAKQLGMSTTWIGTKTAPRPGIVDRQIARLTELEE